MRILLCDDNPQFLKQLEHLLTQFFSKHEKLQPQIICYDNGDNLLEAETRADIAFLDVEMIGTSGIHVGAQLKQRCPYIKIFIVTNYPEYLDEAMHFQVFRYLTKPIDTQRLYRNLSDAVRQYNEECIEYPIESNDGLFVRRTEEIMCAKSEKRHSVIYTTLGEEILTPYPIGHWQKIFTQPCFFIAHQSYIINMKFVNRIEYDSVLLKYKELSLSAYLARRKYSILKETYLLYSESVQ